MGHFDTLGGGDLQYLALENEAAADGLRVEGHAHRKLERCRVQGLAEGSGMKHIFKNDRGEA